MPLVFSVICISTSLSLSCSVFVLLISRISCSAFNSAKNACKLSANNLCVDVLYLVKLDEVYPLGRASIASRTSPGVCFSIAIVRITSYILFVDSSSIAVITFRRFFSIFFKSPVSSISDGRSTRLYWNLAICSGSAFGISLAMNFSGAYLMRLL